ncbi:DUF732 domain-containing protein [Mycolicibacter icosiumassiliensis]|uniref:DUF732 domain-containing protein n=1 Tax=Mycolicibacter icosiumassiliensis TaxID=1792835 RepID=UPI0008309A0C|nr:DUF732 domain-containing protein [Mycolicibacter icosiumassiliensis]
MSKENCRQTKTGHQIPLWRRGFPTLPVLVVTSACAAAVVGMGMAPAYATPNDPYVYVTSATDDTFLRALDGLGIAHPNDPEAVNVARGACAYMQDGHTVREAVDGVRNSYSNNLPLLQGAHFVAVARAVYCPDRLEE